MRGVLPFGGVSPTLGENVFLAPGAYVVGDVHIGAQSSVWFGAVVRGDVGWVRIGARSNIQDGSVVHVTGGRANTTIGDEVTVGHRAILHGCVVEDGCLIGMGSVVMDDARIGEASIVAAGAVVPPGMMVPPGSVVVGVPAKIVRPARPEELRMGRDGAERYVALATQYREQGE
jgi:carbonic anhydrase/acetyltransferase-like protein (isoleucine patch superfamily)